jgi:hypothetical protein
MNSADWIDNLRWLVHLSELKGSDLRMSISDTKESSRRKMQKRKLPISRIELKSPRPQRGILTVILYELRCGLLKINEPATLM